jgi:hypothetical protein
MRGLSRKDDGNLRRRRGALNRIFPVVLALVMCGSLGARDSKEEILRFLIGKSNPSATQLETLDLNGDQQVNVPM